MSGWQWVNGLVRDGTNLSLARRKFRRIDGALVTMMQSGTYWLRHMLAHVLCRAHDLPEPTDLADQHRFVRTPRSPRVHAELPELVHFHYVPSPLVHAPPLGRWLRFPPYVLLVRDMRAALTARYARHGETFGCPFGEFLRGDPRRRRFRGDIWWQVRFLNAWSRVRQWQADRVMTVHYEHLWADTRTHLRRVCAHFGIAEKGAKPGPISDGLLDEAIAASSKQRMAQQQRTGTAEPIVRLERADPVTMFNAEDRRFFQSVVQRHLRDDFGYDYADWSSADRGPVVGGSEAALHQSSAGVSAVTRPSGSAGPS